ncbi:ABC transporter permease family protein [Mesomycoplasma neurolyticum]|uniref:ABC-type maltose transport systems, permease component n=1 Tax=Mesomycoplasma neurolyticum TaxID=2120 RepID=A0A449A5K9_9BACT|nr:carbohydrate ABC transporter permease [Mesomycoplasma neurolyticum]VEU59512.1 ABC-type maltose transport systems, permease component [Mesomycoplasma neurolyticum]
MLKKIIKNLLKISILSFLVLLLLYPIYYLLLFSFLSKKEFQDNVLPLFSLNINFSNYHEIFNENFNKALLLTLSSVFVMIIFRITVYSCSTIIFINIKNIAKKTFLFLILIITVIPEFSLYLGLKKILFSIDEQKKFFFITMTANSIFAYFLLNYLFRQVEKIKKEKQFIILNDNLSALDKLRIVYLPKLKMPYFLIIIFSIINVWNDYLWPNFLLSGFKEQNITIWFRGLGEVGLGASFVNVKAAGAFVSLSIPYMFYLIFSKFINRELRK